MKDGRRFGAPPKPHQPPAVPQGKINTTDHDSTVIKTVGPAMQGYNAQAAVNENQIVVAAEVTVDPPDFGHLEPMVDATVRELAAVGAESPKTVVADAGYWHKRQMENVVSRGMQVLCEGGRRGASAGRASVAGSGSMNGLREALVEYLAVRRALGYRLERTERLLRQFLDYLDAAGIDQITVEHALEWATLPGAGEHWHAMRLGAVRGFARYLHEVDPRVQVPPADLLPDRPCRAVPYLYTDEEIKALLEAAGTLRSAHKAATLRTLFGLLIVTGMRIGEAIALDRADFDADLGTLIIRHGKFGKSRELPLHPTTTGALTRYLQRSDRPPPAGPTEALLVSNAGTRLWVSDVETAFRALRARAGILRARLPADRACMTCATALLSARCSMPTAPTAILLHGSRRCPPTSVTSIPARRIGIYRLRPS